MIRKGLYDEQDMETPEDRKVENNSSVKKDNSEELKLTREIDYQFNIDDSIIYFFDEVNEFTVFDFISRVRTILKNNPDNPINMLLNSPGGSVYDMNALIDYIESLPVPVNIIVRGKAMSAAAVVLAAATGKRYASKRSTIMFHEASSFSVGKQSDLKANVKHIDDLEKETNILLGNVTKKSAEWWENSQKTDLYLTAQQALELGVIDEII